MTADRYQIERPLEMGGTAEVFQASVRGAEGFVKSVAIKRLKRELADEPELVDAFVEEARTTSRLRHRNLVSVLDFGFMDELPFAVLELIDGHALADAAPLPEAVALFVMAEVAHALAYVHGEGVVHRDVAPENVMIADNGDVKLTDFGLAKEVGRIARTQPGLIRGRLPFMSPERFRGETSREDADVYAAGLLLVFAATGHSPLEDDEVRERVFAGAPCPLPELSTDLLDIASAALAPRNARPTARELAERCEHALLDRRVLGRSALVDHLKKKPPVPKPRTSLSELVNVVLLLDEEEPSEVRQFRTQIVSVEDIEDSVPDTGETDMVSVIDADTEQALSRTDLTRKERALRSAATMEVDRTRPNDPTRRTGQPQPNEPTRLAPTRLVGPPTKRMTWLIPMLVFLLIMLVAMWFGSRPQERPVVRQDPPTKQVPAVVRRPAVAPKPEPIEAPPPPPTPRAPPPKVKRRPKAPPPPPTIQPPVPERSVEQRLAQVRKRLLAASKSLPPDQFRALERRYLDIKTARAEGRTGAQLEASLRALERELR